MTLVQADTNGSQEKEKILAIGNVPAPKQARIVACIPAYNEDITLPSVIMKSQKFVDCVLVCDDGSKDETTEVASKLNAVVITNDQNQGKGFAMRRLFEQALEMNPEVVVTLDSDGQHDPNEIPKLIEPVLKGEVDIVLGSRYVSGAWTDAPFYRRIGLKVVNALNGRGNGNGKTAFKVTDTQNGYRAFSRKAIEAMLQCSSNGFGIESEELEVAQQHNLRLKEVPVNVKYYGLARTSKKNPLQHGMEIIDAILNLLVQRRPLYLLGLPGAVLVFAGISLGGYALWEFNITRYFSVPFALAAVGTFIVGVFFVMTSLILYGMSTIKNSRI